MKTCQFCGKEFLPNAKACDGCGALRTTYLTCAYCDSLFPSHLTNCPRCGASPTKKISYIEYKNDYPVSFILTFMVLGVFLLGLLVIGISDGFDSTDEVPLIDPPTTIVDTADDEFLADLDTALDFFSFNQNKCSNIWLYHQQFKLLEQYHNAEFEDFALKTIATGYISGLDKLIHSVNTVDSNPESITITNRMLWLEGYAEMNEALAQNVKRYDEFWSTDYDYIYHSMSADCARLELLILDDLQTQLTDINLRDCGDGTCALDYINHSPANITLTFTTNYAVNGQIRSEMFTSEELYPNDTLTIIYHSPFNQTVVNEISWTIDHITINGQSPEDYYWRN